ncbi:sugar kinase [uncultured Paenibacillus sp.]|uniref:sugar kinase n=1 Tax=uncultured Paenibacillus sp. TaxID=227322 RepID=UPI0028D737D0|nr:sugar kinase [uncultured Paenibacillus sp.]
MHQVFTIGELLVEIMRTETNSPLSAPGLFAGPYPSGAPAIFIDAVAQWGLKAGIVGAVGEDAFGRCLIERLEKDRVDCTHVHRSGSRTTGMAFVTYYDDGSREFLFHMKDSAAVDIPRPDNPGYLAGTNVLHISGTSLTINEEIRAMCYEAVRFVKNAGGIVTFDPNLRPELAGDRTWVSWYKPVLEQTDILLPSGEELEWLTGCASADEAAVRLHEQGVSLIIRKMGEQGSMMYLDGAPSTVAPGFRVDCVDPTGAGDCFNAGVVYGYLQGWAWEDTLRFANAAAALSTTVRGPMEGIRDLATIQAFMNQYHSERQA